jgi:Zn-dependent metalloprotease
MEVIKRLPRKGTVDFAMFRDMVLARAQALFGAKAEETVRQSFRAVGL